MKIEKPYCLAVRALIGDAQGRILFLRRSRTNKNYVGLWELPGGKADGGEQPGQTVHREVREETGLEITLGNVVGAYDIEMTDKRVAVICIQAKATGRTVTLSDEHDEYQWLTAGEIGAYELVGGLKEMLRKNL